MLFVHAGSSPRTFKVPELAKPIVWRKFIDTGAAPPEDIYDDHKGPPLPSDGKIPLQERSFVCYVSTRGR